MIKYCICKHSRKAHSELNNKHWDRLSKQIIGYKDTPKNRERFWKKFLLGGNDNEWKCARCCCQEFKMDNLKLVEDIAKERKLV